MSKRIIESLVCGVFFFLITLFLNRDNIDWMELIITTLVFVLVYFLLSILFDKLKKN